MNMFKKNGGFTLVELIVVIAILAILAGVAVPAYTGYVEKAEEASTLSELSAILTAAQAAAALDNDTVASITVTADSVSVSTTGGDTITDLTPFHTGGANLKGQYASGATWNGEWGPTGG